MLFKVKIPFKAKEQCEFKIVLKMSLLTNAKKLIKSYDLVEFFV